MTCKGVTGACQRLQLFGLGGRAEAVERQQCKRAYVPSRSVPPVANPGDSANPVLNFCRRFLPFPTPDHPTTSHRPDVVYSFMEILSSQILLRYQPAAAQKDGAGILTVRLRVTGSGAARPRAAVDSEPV